MSQRCHFPRLTHCGKLFTPVGMCHTSRVNPVNRFVSTPAGPAQFVPFRLSARRDESASGARHRQTRALRKPNNSRLVNNSSGVNHCRCGPAAPHSTLYANGSPWPCTWKSRIFSCSDVLMLRACIGVPIGSS